RRTRSSWSRRAPPRSGLKTSWNYAAFCAGCPPAHAALARAVRARGEDIFAVAPGGFHRQRDPAPVGGPTRALLDFPLTGPTPMLFLRPRLLDPSALDPGRPRHGRPLQGRLPSPPPHLSPRPRLGHRPAVCRQRLLRPVRPAAGQVRDAPPG